MPQSLIAKLRKDLKTYTAAVEAIDVHKSTNVLEALQLELRRAATEIDDGVAALILKHATGQHAGQALSVLVVDDQPSNRMVLETILARAGFTVRQASTSDEALKAFLAEDYSIAIVDIHLGTLIEAQDGIALLGSMSDLLQGGERRTKIIGMSIDNDPGTLEQAYRHGAVDWISKPIDPQRVLQQIYSAISAEETFAAPDASIIDATMYSRLQSLGSRPKVGAIIHQGIRDANALIEALRLAVEDNNVRAWREALTALHGVSANLAATRLSNTLRLALRDQEALFPARGMAYVETFLDELAAVRATLEPLHQS